MDIDEMALSNKYGLVEDFSGNIEVFETTPNRNPHSTSGSKEIDGLMLMTIEPEIQRNLEPLHAHEMLREQEEEQSVSSYVLKMKGYIDNLERLGHPVTLGLGKGKKHKKSQSQMAAKGQNHGKGKNKQAYAPKPNIPPPPKRENPAKDSICDECGEIGHWKRNCPQYLAELLKKKKTQLLELVVQGLRASRKLKPGAHSLYVSNGQCEAVEAIDAFYLCLPSGLEIVLNNCLYAPVIPRDGIFEIDLSNSLTNESSIYDVSNKSAKLDLDSALLWHCCLGHISKKRIEKLQHDGLLDSSDLRVFEKCVSCMSGKMARKSYTHQTDPTPTSKIIPEVKRPLLGDLRQVYNGCWLGSLRDAVSDFAGSISDTMFGDVFEAEETEERDIEMGLLGN
nr:hypothetical protein [Tanacetum cinerariifolium]